MEIAKNDAARAEFERYGFDFGDVPHAYYTIDGVAHFACTQRGKILDAHICITDREARKRKDEYAEFFCQWAFKHVDCEGIAALICPSKNTVAAMCQRLSFNYLGRFDMPTTHGTRQLDIYVRSKNGRNRS